MRVQQALDLLDARLRESILTTFLSNEYVPMSDAGFALMTGAVRGVLSAFAADGIILGAGEEGGFTVTAPKVVTISPADKIAGKMPNLKFFATLPNDMLRVEVLGNISF